MGSFNESYYNELIKAYFENFNNENYKYSIGCQVHKNEGMKEFVYKLNVNF